MRRASGWRISAETASLVAETRAATDTQPSGKIRELSDLPALLQRLREAGKIIVHCHGVFDLVHVGHVRYLSEAKSMGDALVVTITPDRYVNKGPHRPAFTESLRAEVVAALDVVDYVAVNAWPTGVETIHLLRPHVYVKGPDYAETAKDVTGGITLEAEAIRSVGGELRFTSGVTFSSSELLNRYMSVFSPEVTAWLSRFRSRYRAADVIKYIEALRSLRVVVVGEAILDEYLYCDTLGKSAKEPILALRFLSSETHAGGSLAIANHLADFCESVELVTYLGAENPREDFVSGRLKPNVRPAFIYKASSPTIVKRRFVEKYLVSKLLEVYEINDDLLTPAEDAELCEALEKRVPECDVAIVADFGHGLLTARARELLCDKAAYLAVNTQINAANMGYHTISKYRRADYICVHEGEIRLDGRDRNGDLRELVIDVARRLGCETVMITRGKHGSLLYRAQDGFSWGPSLAVRVLDRLGAGDAVLAITSLCAARRFPSDVMGFIANLVGAQAVMIVGNSASIDRISLLKSIESLLK